MAKQDDIKHFLNEEDNDSNILVKNFLEKNNIFNLDIEQQLIKVVKLISEIPWGKARTIKEVFEKNVGTCTGKHLLLQACLDELNIENKQIMCTFKWSEQGINFPEKLKAILNEEDWLHGHNFVQVKKEDGTKIDIDINWNSKLKDYGFKTLPEDWDGKISFHAVNFKERFDNVDMKSMKIKLIESLDEKTRKRRELFLNEMFKWVGEINKI